MKYKKNPAMQAVAFETNGCRDVFHGAYASALCRGRTVDGCGSVRYSGSLLTAPVSADEVSSA